MSDATASAVRVEFETLPQGGHVATVLMGGMPPSEYAKAVAEKAERPTLILSTA